MINKLLIQIGVGVGVLFLIALLWYSGQVAQAERDLAEGNYEIAQQANQSILDSLQAERAERERIEQLLANRIERQKEIELEAEERIHRKDEEIASLRKASAEVDAYLSIPAPTAYLKWLRERTGGNADTDDQDVSTGNAGTADP